jgi:hypothetical protein
MVFEKLIGFLLFGLPSCISMALGLQLILFLVFPSWYPGVHETIIDWNWGFFVAMNGLACVTLPVILLYCITREVSG